MIDQASAPRSRRRRATLLSLPVGVALTWLVAAIVTPGFADDFLMIWAISATVTTSTGALILWRHPGHHMGRLLIAVGLMFGASAAIGVVTILVDPLQARFGRWTELALLVREVLSTASLLVGSIAVVVRFPSGRRSSRLGLFVEVLAASVIVGMVVGAIVPDLNESLQAVAILPAFVAYPLAVVDIVRRYRRAKSAERAQFRWLIAAASVSGTIVVLMSVFGDRADWLWGAWIASTVLPTIAVGFAVLRYHLYDIDRIISRTIAYFALSVALFAIFFVTNLLLQQVISPLVGGNVVATAVSTLLIAALFQPVRRVIQQRVDRRFHRARYDAERTLDAFVVRLRGETAIATVTSDLARTAAGVVGPSTSVVWVRGGQA